MFKTKATRYLNPLLWALVGWLVAVAGNAVAGELARLRPSLIHVDEVAVGLLFGAMRWMHGEWRMDRVHASREMERKVRDALVVLRYGGDEAARSNAMNAIVEALEEHRPVHRGFLAK